MTRLRLRARDAAFRLLRRHGFACRGCGVSAAWELMPARDLFVCGVCGHEVLGIKWAIAVGRPWRLWVLGL